MGPAAATAVRHSAASWSRERDARHGQGSGDFGIAQTPPHPIGADKQHIVPLQHPSLRDGHVRQDRIAPQAALHVIAHGVIVRLIGRNQTFAQQQFDVAMVASARRHRALAQQVDPAIAHVCPVG